MTPSKQALSSPWPSYENCLSPPLRKNEREEILQFLGKPLEGSTVFSSEGHVGLWASKTIYVHNIDNVCTLTGFGIRFVIAFRKSLKNCMKVKHIMAANPKQCKYLSNLGKSKLTILSFFKLGSG